MTTGAARAMTAEIVRQRVARRATTGRGSGDDGSWVGRRRVAGRATMGHGSSDDGSNPARTRRGYSI